MIASRQSNALHVIRAFAILSVISAHMPFGDEHPLAESLRIIFGQIGVAVFFIVSGFFYHREDGDTRFFWRKKWNGIIVPWIILSLCTYIFSAVLNKEFSIVAALKWMVGVQTWYWFLPILLLMFALFKKLWKSNVMLIICIATTGFSIMCSAFNLIPYTYYFNQYLNPLNWIGLFALGVWLRKYELLNALIGMKALSVGVLVFLASTLLSLKYGMDIAYTDYFSLPCELSGFIIFYNLSFYLRNKERLKDIGKKSFFIYLIQMQPAGIFNTRLPYTPLFFILRPLIVLIVLYFISIAIISLLRKTGIEKYSYFIAL